MSAPSSLRMLWHLDPVYRARRALEARDEATVQEQITLSEIAAPTGQEARRAAWVAHRFRALELDDVRVDVAGNVLGRRAGAERDAAPVVICAHLDTVFPSETDVAVQRDGARLQGPGIGDNGRGLAGMLALAAALDGRALRTRTPVDFVATTGEEGTGDLRGAKHLFANGARKASAMIALDGAGDERIVHRALASRRYRVVMRGSGGHSWTAYGVPNPVHAIALMGAKLARLPLRAEPRTTLTIGRIGGGISINSIPEDAWMEIDLRSTSPAMIERIDREIRLAARAAEHEESERRVRGAAALVTRFTVIGERPGGLTPADHPLVVSAVEATRLIGRDADLATASTDANVPISLGIPAIAIGAGGRGGDAHTPGEWFDNAEGHLGISRALGVVLSAAGLM